MMAIITDFLNQMYITLPLPIFALVVAIIFALFGSACYFALWVFLLIIALIPGTGFLFVDMKIEEKLVRNLTSFIQNRRTTQSPKLVRNVSRSYRTDPRNRQLQHQLIGMLRGDVATAKRLLKQQRQLNPGNSDNWYLEKVIYDLERDRRC